MDLQFTLDFLSDLATHNNKEWMDDNRKQYQEAKNQVIELVAEVLAKISQFDSGMEGIDARKTLFRINRDIRFSKNKDPYKTNFGASLVEGGRKSGNPGYYLHIMPDNNFVGGGIYQPDPGTLQKVRQEIDYNGTKLREIIEEKTFRKIYDQPHDADRLKTAPKGYPKDHPDLDLLQLKHYVFMNQVEQKEVIKDSFVDRTVEAYKVIHPFNQFLKEAIS